MRKPENREKFKKIIATMTEFYAKQDAKMVVEVLEEETVKAKELALRRTSLAQDREARRELKRIRMKVEERLNGQGEGNT